MKDSLLTNTANLDLESISPELKSYIYQIIAEFEPFSTPETVITVIAKEPLKKEKNKFRISISLVEDGTKLEDEGLDEDIYIAIKLAKDKLIKRLCEIQDQMISSQERKVQIDSAASNGQVH